MEFHHTYISGMTRMGKTSHALDITMNRIYDGFGCLWLDPHGYDSEWLIDHIPAHRVNDVIYFDPTKYSIALNPLAVPDDQKYFLAKTMATAVKILAGYDKIAAPRITNTVQYTILALMAAGAPLAEFTDFHTNETVAIPRPVPEGRHTKKDKQVPYHEVVRAKVTDKLQKQFWHHHFTHRTGKERNEYVDSSLSQMYNLLLDPRIRQTFSQRRASFNIQDVLDNNLIFIARLPQGQLGLDTVTIVGSLLLCLFHIAGLARTSRLPFTIIADEGHTWVAPPMMEILSGGGKFQLWLMFMHQYIGQFKDEQLFEALMGNCGEKHVFRMSRDDSLKFEEEQGRYGALNIYELPRFTYRNFSFQTKPEDVTVTPLKWAEFPKNRQLIEGNMVRNYVKGAPQ